jgi:hypothetical protein
MKQSRLRCLGHAPGIVGLGAFAGDPVAVNSGFNHQVECVRCETEFVLRDRQAASVSFHVG